MVSNTFEDIVKLRTLPRPSRLAETLLQLAQQEQPEKRMAAIIATNPGLAEFLRSYQTTVALYEPTSSILNQINRLTPRIVSQLSLIYGLSSEYRHGDPTIFDHHLFWQKALAMGCSSRLLAERAGLPADDGFTCGVLSCIGELALATAFYNDYDKLRDNSATDDERQRKEKLFFGLNSDECTALLLAHWGFQKSFVAQCQVSLNEKVEIDDVFPSMGDTLQLARGFTTICMQQFPLTETFATVESLAMKHGLSGAMVPRLFDRLRRQWQLCCELLELPPVSCPIYEQLKLIDQESEVKGDGRTEQITILLADDDPITLLALQRVLERDHRHILVAEDGEQALQLALEHQPHMLITDWRMPRLNGLDLCRILRRTSLTEHVYIIMLTGKEADDDLVEAFDAGADEYVIKPFIAKVLQARILSGERLIRYQRTIQRDREVIQRYAARLAAANRKLENMAMTDFLTGLPNRRSGLLRLKKLVAEMQRYGEKLSCLMLDIDHFKQINDTYGHDIGDMVLRQVSRVLEEKARSYDTVSRYGGEEFLIICARSDPADTLQLAERLRSAIEQALIQLPDGTTLRITISVGVACWHSDYTNEDQLIKDADTALYRAKSNGRNRVEGRASEVRGSITDRKDEIVPTEDS